MRFLIGTVVTLACLALIGIAAHGNFVRGSAAQAPGEADISVYDLHLNHPNMSNLPVQEPPLP